MMENKNIEKRLDISIGIGIVMYACLTIGMLQIHTNSLQTINNTLKMRQEEYKENIDLLNEKIDVQNQAITNLQQQNEHLKEKINE